MNTLKLIAALTIVAGSLAMVFGTGAFTAIEADRFSDVGVAADGEALLGVSMEGGTVEPGDEVMLAVVENRFGSNIESVEVEVVDEGPFNNVNTDSPDSLPASGPSSSGDITATVAGAPGTGGWIEITIVASSSQGPSVELTREVFVEIERAGLPFCTIENDDRIGDRSLDADGETFGCHIDIDADQQYGVVFEESKADGDFTLSADLLEEWEFEASEVDGVTEITVDNTVNDDMTFEGSDLGDDVSIDVSGPVNGDIEIDRTAIRGTFDFAVENLNSDFELEESSVDDDVSLQFDDDPSGEIEIDNASVGGNLEITIDGNANGDITIEASDIEGDLIITIDGNLNGDITIEDNTIGGDVIVVVERNANGDIELEGNDIDGEPTIDTGGGGGPP